VRGRGRCCRGHHGQLADDGASCRVVRAAGKRSPTGETVDPETATTSRPRGTDALVTRRGGSGLRVPLLRAGRGVRVREMITEYGRAAVRRSAWQPDAHDVHSTRANEGRWRRGFEARRGGQGKFCEMPRHADGPSGAPMTSPRAVIGYARSLDRSRAGSARLARPRTRRGVAEDVESGTWAEPRVRHPSDGSSSQASGHDGGCDLAT